MQKETKGGNMGKKLVGNAIIWAAVMIAVSLLTKGNENSQFINLLMILGWFSTQSMIQSPKAAMAAECAMLRRLLGLGPRAES